MARPPVPQPVRLPKAPVLPFLHYRLDLILPIVQGEGHRLLDKPLTANLDPATYELVHRHSLAAPGSSASSGAAALMRRCRYQRVPRLPSLRRRRRGDQSAYSSYTSPSSVRTR